LSSIEDILAGFDPISLKEMDNVKLQDRIDTKFMFRDDILPAVLSQIHEYYYALDINGMRYNNYETLYFDTPDFKMYLNHQNGRTNRFKFRERRYVESDLYFFEVKFKNNKGRTIKERIKRPQLFTHISDASRELVKNVSNVNPDTLEAKLWVHYRRMTFVGKKTAERLTIDTKMVYQDEKQTVPITGLAIAEVKQGSALDKSPFVVLMKKNRVQAKSISKYCLGVITLNSDIKKNNFKPTLIYLQKLLKAS
jgi:hypothetical protein